MPYQISSEIASAFSSNQKFKNERSDLKLLTATVYLLYFRLSGNLSASARNYQTTGYAMTLLFKTDNTITKPGFHALWTTFG
jgi:hypothetical protein